MQFIKEIKKNIEYYTVPEFSKHGFHNIFTTKLNGESFQSKELNFGTNCGDTKESILENYKNTLSIINAEPKKAVRTKQTHSDIVSYVDETFGGEGIVKEQRFLECDGLITNKKDLTLAIFFADCVPILIGDTKTKLIAAIHSGWRGTQQNIVGKGIQKLITAYESDPNHLICAIGPSIGICHFEVSFDVYKEITNLYGPHCGKIENNKYYLDLKGTVETQMLNLGVLKENIAKSDLCTVCEDELYSYRREGEKAGRMAGFIKFDR